MTATVIQLPTGRLARSGSAASRRRHPAGGRPGAAVVSLERIRHQRQVVVEAHLQAIERPARGPDWVLDAHAAIDGFTDLLDAGRIDDVMGLCDRALTHLTTAADEIDDPVAIGELTDHLRLVQMMAWRADQPR